VTHVGPLRLAFLGYGTVNRALHALLHARRDALREEHGIEWLVTGVASRRIGWRAAPRGLDPEAPDGPDFGGVRPWLDAARPAVVLEAIALDPQAGQPALDYLRAALDAGAHAISANKGPVVHGWRDLDARARRVGRRYRFEAAVADGAPVFSLARALPLAGLRGVRGVFTSTATVVVEAVEDGLSVADGVARAQALGIAEADPSYDVDGWDSAVKLCAIGNVLLGADLRPADVAREGVGTLDADAVRAARRAGTPIRLVGEVRRDASGAVSARVRPEPLGPDDPLGTVRGATLVMHWDAEVFPGGLTVSSRDPDPTTTAFGMLADLVEVCSVRRADA
jgi:homoserine dehydrogenase